MVQLGHAIAGRGPCLVVLDNFEQVVGHAEETLGCWLDRAPEARFVVTIREVLGLPGETALALAPLISDESVDLFVTRARQAMPGFMAEDEASIQSLVSLLDGLPLAIELAAARGRCCSGCHSGSSCWHPRGGTADRRHCGEPLREARLARYTPEVLGITLSARGPR